MGLYSIGNTFLKLLGRNSLGNLNLISTPYSEIVVLPDFPIVPLELISNLSAPWKIFLLVKEVSKAIPMSSILECLMSNPKPKENLFFGFNKTLASSWLFEFL